MSFLWGTATSAYQIEGAVGEDGRGESIWDRFCRTPGNVYGGHTGDVACDHYHRYEEDLDLMRDLGVGGYRFSIAWPRIQPSGSGEPSERGLDFYRRLAAGLRERGIVPVATLYHWDLPQALQDAGGWGERTTSDRFAEYASHVVAALGDLVPLWITHNEPHVAAFLGHAEGVHAPGIRDWGVAVRVSHHLLLSHGLALDALRTSGPPGLEAGITLNLSPVWPASDRPEDVAAADRVDAHLNRWFLDPVLRGAYPEELFARYESELGPGDWLRDGDLDVVSLPLDFVGVNYYFPLRVAAGREGPLGIERLPPQGRTTAMGWEVSPDGFHELLVRLGRDYPGTPLYVTENGAAHDDEPDPAGAVDDPDRIDYLRSHVDAVERARAEGADVRGYFLWSLLDNFEWAHGYSKRFGIVYVDFETQQRIPKASARWYRDLIAARR